MGAKSKAEQYGLVEVIIDKWEGGKHTIVYVTDEVKKEIDRRGLKVSISREGIRKVIRTHKEQIEEYKQALEMSKELAKIFKDEPATEITEGAIMTSTMLLQKALRDIDGVEFDDPDKLFRAVSNIAGAHERLSSYRMKASKALNKAKEEIKKELQNAIQGDTELLEKLCNIVDKVEIK